MRYWLVKTEPDTYSWSDLEKDNRTVWDGIRNYQARKFLMEMKKGDVVLVYHTGNEKAIIGTAEVIRESFPDPEDPEWLAVELKVKKKLKKPVTLSAIKARKKLQTMMLVRAPRLSVQPVQPEEFREVVQMSEAQ
jgi:predicted RNA-binding protein with PUA-like domain